MNTIIPKFSIGSSPIWLHGRNIINLNREYKVSQIHITKNKDYCTIKYDLISSKLFSSSRWSNLSENELFQTEEELKNSIN